jgi:hypothetical protein
MHPFISGIQTHALTASARAKDAVERLAAWAEAGRNPEPDERGSYSTEMVVIISAIVLLALTIVAIIVKKTVDKANSINF